MKYLLLFAFLIFPTVSQAVWFDSSWDYRVKVEVAPSKVGSSTAITGFPVYVDLAGMPASFFTNSQGDGDDVRVVESDETTETPFELVSIATTTKRGELHFLADSLATTSTSTFYVYYGNPAASAYATTSTYGRNAVWTAYRVVYHMDNTTDSAGNYDLTNNGSVTFTDGRAGNAASITSSGQYLGVGSQIGITSAESFSISMWVKMASETTVDRDFFGYVYNQSTDDSVHRGVYEYNGGSRRNRFYRSGNASTFLDQSGNFADNTWKQWAYTWNVSGGGMNMYRDAGTPTTGTNNNTGTQGNSSRLSIGGTVEYSYTRPVDGLVDETRVAEGVLSRSWLITEYNNFSSTSTFLYIGAEEADTSSPPEATTTPSTLLRGGAQIRGGIIVK